MVPELVSARAHSASRIGVAFGPRFFVLLAVGLMWLAPALVDSRFVYAMVAWDVLVLIAWLTDVLRLPAPARLTVQRAWAEPLALSVPSRVTLTLVNESATAIRATIVDATPHQLRGSPPSLQIDVGPGGGAEAAYPIAPTARGEIAIGDAYIRYQSGLRIAERWARAGLAQAVVSYPNLDEARRESLSVSRSQQNEMRRRARSRRGIGRSFESLREYQNGDELRDICWTASARRGKLVTRLYESERSQPIWIVIDSGRLMRAQVGETTKLDHAVNAALTLAQVALGSGDRVGLLAYGRGIRHAVAAGRGHFHLRDILEHLARVGAEESEADHWLAASRLLTDQKRRSLVVWLTDVPDVAMTPEVVSAASQLMQRHLVLFVVIGQPDLQRIATRKAASVDEMYETAAAEEVLHRRDLLLARLRSQGALAFESGVRLSPALVSAYLEVKLRNRL
jgi:uncharacterized protein (DUF58 family)